MRTGPNSKTTFKRYVTGLAVAALLWSSGQGFVLSTALNLLGNTGTWHCVMMPGGGMSQPGGAGTQSPSGPTNTDHGFCPVCSLTGCGSVAVTLTSQTEGPVAWRAATRTYVFTAQLRRNPTHRPQPPARAPPILT